MARGNAVVPGMNSGINVNDPRVASAFLAALRHEGLVAVLIFATLGLAWVTIRAWGRADRGYLAALGAGGRELGGYDMVVSPAAGSRGRGVDPGRHRDLAARGAARPVLRSARRICASR